MAKDVSLIRIKADTNDYERSIRQAQKTWDSFTKGLGINMSKFTGVGAAIAGVSAALKVAKDAFFKNEQMLDEWGRTVKSSESLYSGFLNALNNGNISGYLQNIGSIVRAAREAYDALDALGTYNAFNQINQEKARTGFTEAMANFREGSGSKEGVQAAADALKEELRKRQKKEYDAYVKAIYDKANTMGIGGAVLQRILEGSTEQYEQYKNLGLTGNGGWYMGGGGPATAANEQEKIGEALRQLNDTELDALQALGLQAQRTATEIENVNKQVARVLRETKPTSGSGAGTGSKGSKKEEAEKYIPAVGSIDYMQEKVKELQTAFEKTADEGVRGKLYTELQNAKLILDTMNEGLGMTLERSSGPTNFSKDFKIDSDIAKIGEDLAQSGEAAATSWGEAMGAISGLSGALAAIEDPAVKVLGIIAEAIATIALTFAKSLKGTVTPWDWIAGAAAGTATMIATIAAIKSATAGSYAEGGIIPGNSFSGDNLQANVNSGELILNRAQQNNIASLLRNQNEGGRSYQPAYVSGEQIYIAMNRYLKRSGQGELMTWKS